MKVHSITLRVEKDAFVVSAEIQRPNGFQVMATGAELGEWYKPERLEQCFSTAEDAVSAIGRLLRDGVE